MKSVFEKKAALMIASASNEVNGMLSRLRTQGLSIELISSGFQALSHIEKSLKNNTLKYDVVILFENCGDMPQREALNLIRVLVDSKKLPIVSFAKDSEIEEIQELIIEGANEFLSNYSDFNLVIEKLNKIFAKAK